MMESFSQIGQDLHVVEHFRGERAGFFVEVGAYDGVTLSNTLALEKNFGWSGICIEPMPAAFVKLLTSRKCRKVQAAVYERSGELLTFVHAQGEDMHQMLSGTEQHLGRHRDLVLGGQHERFDVVTATLTDVLDHCGAPRFIHYMSIDTEGSELQVLQGLDTKYTVGYMSVQHNYEEPRRGHMRALLRSRGYTRIAENNFEDDYVFDGGASRGVPRPVGLGAGCAAPDTPITEADDITWVRLFLMGRPVNVVVGTGRCGTHSAAVVLGRQDGTNAFHEVCPASDLHKGLAEPPPWTTDPSKMWKCLRLLLASGPQAFRRVALVGFFWVNYLDDLVKHTNVRSVVRLHRDIDSAAASLVKYTGTTDYWQTHAGAQTAWDAAFPKYGPGLPKLAAVTLYCQEYLSKFDDFAACASVPCRTVAYGSFLNDGDTQRSVLQGMGYEGYTECLGVVEFANP
jgi:FkbM family methyltransferase